MAEAKLSVLINVSGTEQANSALKVFGQELGNVAKTAAAFTLGGLGTQLAGDLAEQFRSVLVETRSFGEAVYKLQAQIGGSAESISTLLGAMEKLGGIQSDMAGAAMVRFSRGLRGQADESDASAQSVNQFNGVLASLGVRATDAAGNLRPLQDVFSDVLDSEKKLADQGRAGADAMALFGRGAGLQLAPMLLLGSQAFKEAQRTAAELGLQLTGDSVAAIHEFTIRQREASEALGGLKLQLGVALMGPLSEMAKGLRDVAEASNRASTEQAKSSFQKLGDAAADAFWKIRTLNDYMNTKGTAQLPGGAGNQSADLIGDWLHDTGFPAVGAAKDQLVTGLQNLAVMARTGSLEAGFAAGRDRAAGASGPQLVSGAVPPDFEEEAKVRRAEAIAAAAATTTSLAKQMAQASMQDEAAKRALQIISQDITVAQRQSLDLIKEEAAAQMELIPLKQQQGELAIDLLRTENQRASIERQAAVDRARLTSLPSSRALEDSQYRQSLIQAQIRSGVMSGTGIPLGAIPELIELKRGQAALELAALQGGRSTTLAQRLAESGQLGTNLSTASLREAQADLQLSTAHQQLAIDTLHSEIEKERLAATEKIADLEMQRRRAEDAAFSAGQKKAELAPTIGTANFTINQHINSGGEPDYERIKNDAIAGFVALMTKTAANIDAPAPSTVPGASY